MKSLKLNNFKHLEAEYISLIVKAVSILFLITQFYIIYANRSIINAKSVGWSLFKPNFVISLWSSILYFGVMVFYLAIYTYTLKEISNRIKSDILKGYMLFNLVFMFPLLSLTLAIANQSNIGTTLSGVLFVMVLGLGVLGMIFSLAMVASSTITKNSPNLSKYFIFSPLLTGPVYIILSIILVILLDTNVFLGFGLIILINYLLIRKLMKFPKAFDDLLIDLEIQLVNRIESQDLYPTANF